MNKIKYILLLSLLNYFAYGEVVKTYAFNGTNISGWQIIPEKDNGCVAKLSDGKLILDLTSSISASKMVCSDFFSIPETKTERIIKISGKVEIQNFDASRFELKLLRGFAGGQEFCDTAFAFEKNNNGEKSFTKSWKLEPKDLSAKLYIIFDKEATGKVLFDEIKVEVFAYNEELLSESVALSGKVLYQNDFSKSIQDVSSNSPVVQLKHDSQNSSMLMSFGESTKSSKSLVFPALTLPYLPLGERGEMELTIEYNLMKFAGRRVEIKPLFSNGNHLEFPPPYINLMQNKQQEKVVGRWIFDSNYRNVQLYIAVDGDSTGDIEIKSVKIEIFPEASAKIVTNFESNVIPFEQATIDVIPFDAESLTSGIIQIFNENNTVLQEIPLAKENKILLDNIGYYQIKVIAKYPNKEITTCKSVSLIGQELPLETIKQSKYGVVSVNGSDKLLKAINSHWNWKFTGLAGAKLNLNNTISPATEWKIFPVNPFTENIYTAGNMPQFLQEKSNEQNAIYKPTDEIIYKNLIKTFASSENFPKYYNVFNEPEGKWRGSWEDFVLWHKLTRDAVKSVRPDVSVSGPAFCNINMHLVRKLGSLGLFDALDAVNVHPYVEGTAPELEFISRIDDFEQYLASIGKSDMPIFYTEFGWTTGVGGWQKSVTREQQAQYVARSLSLLGTTKMTACVYFALFYRNVNKGEEGFSLIANDNTPTPSLNALATSFKHLGNISKVGKRIKFSPNIFLNVFETNDKQMLVTAWSTSDEELFVPPFEVTKAFNIMGQRLELTNGNKFNLSQNIIYLYSNDKSLLDLEMLPAQKLLANSELEHNLVNPIVFAPLEIRQNKVYAPTYTRHGDYMALGKIDNQFKAIPIRIPGAIELFNPNIIWELDQMPVVKITLQSNFDMVKEIQLIGELNGTTLKSKEEIIKGNDSIQLTLDLPEHIVKNGGSLILKAIDKQGNSSNSEKVDISLLPVFKTNSEKINWDKIAKLNWNTFDAFSDKNYNSAHFDNGECSATLQGAYNEHGLIFRIIVKDDEHHQKEIGADIWKNDSIQLAFDVDSAKPWEPNAQLDRKSVV